MIEIIKSGIAAMRDTDCYDHSINKTMRSLRADVLAYKHERDIAEKQVANLEGDNKHHAAKWQEARAELDRALADYDRLAEVADQCLHDNWCEPLNECYPDCIQSARKDLENALGYREAETE